MMGIGYIGVNARDAIRRSVRDWPPCSNDRTDGVPIVDCTSNMLTSWKLIISMGIDATPAMPISKPYMDIAMIRKPGTKVNISREVYVTSIRTLRSGVKGNFHAPFWSSGRRRDPSADCNGTRPCRSDRYRYSLQGAAATTFLRIAPRACFGSLVDCSLASRVPA